MGKQGRRLGNVLKWLPTLYFAKGLLYVIIFVVALIMLRQTGLNNAETTVCVALCYLPWISKYWWKPLFDWQRNCPWMILFTELLLVLAFSVLAFALSSLWMSFFLLLLIAILTSVHNVAVDTFYGMEVKEYAHLSKRIPTRTLVIYRTVRELSRKLADVVGIGILVMLVGNLQVVYRNAKIFSWRYMTYCVAFIFLLLFFWHMLVLLRRRDNGSLWDERVEALKRANEVAKNKENDMSKSKVKHGLPIVSVVFLLTFLFASVMQSKMAILFLVENQSSGGLGLSPQEFGFVMGTVGVMGVTVGMMASSRLVRQFGMQRLLLPMGLLLLIPSVVYSMLSFWQPADVWLVSLCVLIEQTSYGIGLSVYLSYQTYLPNKELAKSLMAVSMMVACGLSGALQMQIGYNSFFLTTLSLSILSLLSAHMARKQ